ncbi:MAG: alpha/beta hydrolase [Faecalicatena sp.]|uniref:alpha/beta hydrolase n=1 Tax=Faecalicatena sp. TaxID=2005360 RepID=UPI002582C299|nr:alpha/beta hydrolase [Faecalicatena sp.]MCI6467888.1 alpha/beta hydrolase [Faecalicatena sp.]MDY5619470.1 alpha/beta hydrolase [Lachnospiraceae bacterium]
MDKITEMLTFKQIHELPEFAGCADYIVPVGGEQAQQMANTPLSFFAQIGWSPEAMAYGFGRLQEICAQGKRVYYPLYEGKDLEKEPALRERFLIHFPVEKKTGFVVTCSGGAYIGAASMIEGYPSCKEINDLGYHAFTVNYRAGVNAKAPNPIEDLAVAVRYILDHAEELNVDPENYAVAGFSAGGHLAACFGTEALGWKKYSLPKPAAVILAYPVITMQQYTHEDSRKNFLQEKAGDIAMQKKYSVEEQVTDSYPPTYVWQCERDNTVPIENTQLLIQAFEQYHVPHVYRTFDSEWHGWGCGKGTLAEGWVKEAIHFWEKYRQKA